MINVPVTDRRGVAGREGGCAHHRWPRATEDSAGHAERAEAAPARARRGKRAAARAARRPDRDGGRGGSHAAGRAQPRDHARAGQAEQPGPARGAVQQAVKQEQGPGN